MNDIMAAKFNTMVLVHLVFVCHDCRRRHDVKATPDEFGVRVMDWSTKHAGHRIEMWTPRRTFASMIKDRWIYPVLDRFKQLPWVFAYEPNADFLLNYPASGTFTITLASLASSTSFVAGRESTAVSNTSSKYLEYLIAGKVKTGTSPTDIKTIRVYAYGALNDTPLYPDVLDGTDSDETITSVDILNDLPLLAALPTNNTSDRQYWMNPRPISRAFGVVPRAFGLYVAHDTGVALNATGADHAFYYNGIYITG